jgi:hypothetical protein
MSLDKFVMRGFTGSTGQSMGQWVAKAPQAGAAPQPQTRTPQPGEGSSSFILGSGGNLRPNYNAKDGFRDSQSKNCQDGYSFQALDVMQRGTTPPKNTMRQKSCFSTPTFRGGGGEGAGEVQAYKAITILFFLFAVLVLVAFMYAGRVPNREVREDDVYWRAPAERQVDFGRGMRPSWEPG